MKMPSIDLNADLGEGAVDDADMLVLVSSCNIACGGHTGDADSMATTLTVALQNGVAIGAHPSYPDRDGFGRRSRFLAGAELYDTLTEQVQELQGIAAELGGRMRHLKPHGALYNDAAVDPALADILARVTSEAAGRVALVGLPGSELQRAATRLALEFHAEGFVDRRYRGDGTLVPRSEAGAVFEDTGSMTRQALALALGKPITAQSGTEVAVNVDTLCIHTDTPNAVAAARTIRRALEREGIAVAAMPEHRG